MISLLIWAAAVCGYFAVMLLIARFLAFNDSPSDDPEATPLSRDERRLAGEQMRLWA